MPVVGYPGMNYHHFLYHDEIPRGRRQRSALVIFLGKTARSNLQLGGSTIKGSSEWTDLHGQEPSHGVIDPLLTCHGSAPDVQGRGPYFMNDLGCHELHIGRQSYGGYRWQRGSYIWHRFSWAFYRATDEDPQTKPRFGGSRWSPYETHQNLSFLIRITE